MRATIPDKDNHISCRWNKKEQCYITNAERWRREHMLWTELLALLESMKDKHTSFTDEERVSVIVDNEEFYVDLFESLTTGKIHLVLATMYVEDDDAS